MQRAKNANNLIKYLVVLRDFVVLNALFYLYIYFCF